MYKEELMEHYRSPQNKCSLANPDFVSDQHNPSCGDAIHIEGMINEEKITSLGFGGTGCVISQATASMLTEYCLGKTVGEVMKLNKNDITTLIGLELGPTRLKCALISLQAIQQGLTNYLNKTKKG